ncbi:hypothetical protein [Cecembia lonarensis]|nr:hypothetical protein [Cecembia lonarensis]
MKEGPRDRPYAFPSYLRPLGMGKGAEALQGLGIMEGNRATVPGSCTLSPGLIGSGFKLNKLSRYWIGAL